MTKLNVTFLSNGHGEDTIAVSLAKALLEQLPDAELSAFPTVDMGKAYETLSIPILGPRQIMPSSGLLMHNWELFQGDIRAGFIPMTLKQIRGLSRLKTDVLIVVGDAFALLLSSFVKTRYRFYLQTLVSAHHAAPKTRHLNRFFMEHLSYPERVLIRHLVNQTYVRDALTERVLKATGLTQVSYLGNPMLDGLGGKPMHLPSPVITLLPGTRAYAPRALELMLDAVSQLNSVTALVAWALETDIPTFPHWQQTNPGTEIGLVRKLEQGSNQVLFFKGRYADCLHSADLVIGTSGTANEQAAALGKPVVAFDVPPLYSEAFLENQKRLLAEALTVVKADAQEIALAIQTLLSDKAGYQLATTRGQERMGKAGGSKALIKDMLERIH
ncbi:MAG: lipid-A-disaccharide synthase-related protein [Trueperaceae bacterium]|nr:lipid-A-disaccharide synthase-related protein [Trueperaceae bacterium]